MCETAQPRVVHPATLAAMAERHTDPAGSDKDRKPKPRLRERLRALIAGTRKRAAEEASTRQASLDMHDEGGPARAGD